MGRRKKENIPEMLKITISIFFAIIIIGYSYIGINKNDNTKENVFGNTNVIQTVSNIDLNSIPEYNGSPYVEINNNIPYFKEEDYTTENFENYTELDYLGRCGIAYANICKYTMPKEGEKRGSISNIKPTGWIQSYYKGVIKDEHLYERCHLIGWQLGAENDNKLNLITGTGYMNVEGMLPFENKVDDYIEENENNHVLYRVTPIFQGDNMVVNGVEMEAYSVEDSGKGVCFNVYCYNVQPGINIDYATR